MATIELTDTNGKNGFLAEGDVLDFSPAPEGSVVGKNPVGRPKLDIDEAAIRKLYVTEVKSLGDTAKELGISVLTLRARMDEYAIPVRKRGRPVAKADRFKGGVIELAADGSLAERCAKALAANKAAEADEATADEA